MIVQGFMIKVLKYGESANQVTTKLSSSPVKKEIVLKRYVNKNTTTLM